MIIAVCQVEMPLLSGRYGNALAVALEMQMYKGALYMLQNAQELEIDLDNVSHRDYNNIWDAKKTCTDNMYYNKWPRAIETTNQNIDAAKEIEELLQVNRKR